MVRKRASVAGINNIEEHLNSPQNFPLTKKTRFAFEISESSSSQLQKEQFLLADDVLVIDDDPTNSHPFLSRIEETPVLGQSYIHISRRKDHIQCDVDRLSVVPLKADMLPEPSFCLYCHAKKFHLEPKGFCCSDGTVSLVSYEAPPQLYALFTSASQDAAEFRTYVRTYNNSFAFTSFGVTCDKDLCRRNKGIYTFRAQGQIYHYLTSLHPGDKEPSFLQLYFYDTDHEIQNRLARSNKMRSDIMNVLLHVLQRNPYCQFFRSLSDVMDLSECSIVIRHNAQLDHRVYNAPQASQVAAIWVEDGELEPSQRRDIVVHSKPGGIHSVQYYYGCYDPLQYPLLFPLGEGGWHEGISKNKKNNRGAANTESWLNLQATQTVEEFIHNEAVDAE